MRILGISALYHDSAAALVEDGQIIAAAQEERFTRIKHDKRIPVNAVKFCLNQAGCGYHELDAVVYYDNPLLTLSRFCQNICSLGEEADSLLCRSFNDMTENKMWIRHNLELEFGPLNKNARFLVSLHHVSHAASAFYPSPFEKAVIMTNDGVGEWDTTTIGVGEGKKIKLIKRIKYPHSVGMLYSAFTYFCGFKVNEGDYKFMGLAPYGQPVYYEFLKSNIIDVKEDGSYRLNLKYFDFQNGRTMISKEMENAFGERRIPETRITKRDMDLAASVQKLVEEIIIKQVKYAKTLYPDIKNLVLAGGCALNCVANGKILKEKIFDHIWIQPAAGDAGGAIGCALYAYYNHYGGERKVSMTDNQKSTYLGAEFSDEEIETYLIKANAKYRKYSFGQIAQETAQYLAEGKIVGFFQGRAEFGPRALGNRSILADPRSEKMQTQLNLKIKYRESFRPFAPSVLLERVGDYFELNEESPYMLLCADVREELRLPFSLNERLEYTDMDMLPIVNDKRSEIPAVTHVDFSARIQTVDKQRNPQYYAVIKAFEKITKCGVVVNTSFNVRGEPIVNSPEDAYICFMRTEMDILVIGDFILIKEEQPEFHEDGEWREKYVLD